MNKAARLGWRRTPGAELLTRVEKPAHASWLLEYELWEKAAAH